MTPEQFYEQQRKKGLTEYISSNDSPIYSLPFYQEIFQLMQEYADLQKPKWIPIKSEADVEEISEGGYITVEKRDKRRFVTQVHSISKIYEYVKYIGLKPLAYMIIKYPDPYDK